MIYSVHQPHYLPYLGYLAKVFQSDVFVFLERVQYVRREYQNRNKIKSPDGAVWLTIPVKGEYKTRIDQMTPDDSKPWRENHIETLRRFYAKADYLPELEGFQQVLKEPGANLAELLMRTTAYFLDRFGIQTVRKSQAELEPLPDEPNLRIVEIGKKLGATVYLAGAGGREYMNLAPFTSAGIEVHFQEFQPLPYPQLHGEFIPYLGAIDLLLCTGKDGFSKYQVNLI